MQKHTKGSLIKNTWCVFNCLPNNESVGYMAFIILMQQDKRYKCIRKSFVCNLQ